jgi:hypothetical protein
MDYILRFISVFVVILVLHGLPNNLYCNKFRFLIFCWQNIILGSRQYIVTFELMYVAKRLGN